MKTTKEMIEVMQANLDGREVECVQMGLLLSKDYACWDWTSCDYRIKPLEFPPLPEGMEWSNPSNKTPEEVGEDWRLLTTVECLLDWIEGAQFWRDDSYGDEANRWGWAINGEGGCFASSFQSIRVPRNTPFPEPPKKKVMVPLGPEDIPPGSVFTIKGRPEHDWTMPESVSTKGITFTLGEADDVAYSSVKTWEHAQQHYLIKRPGQDWQPCEKEAP